MATSGEIVGPQWVENGAACLSVAVDEDHTEIDEDGKAKATKIRTEYIGRVAVGVPIGLSAVGVYVPWDDLTDEEQAANKKGATTFAALSEAAKKSALVAAAAAHRAASQPPAPTDLIPPITGRVTL